MPGAKEFLLDLLFPAACYNCEKPKGVDNPTGFLCKACFAEIPVYSWLFCPVCHQKLAQNLPCPAHRYEGALKYLGVASDYQNNILRNLIWTFKYNYVEALYEPISELLSIYFKDTLRSVLDPWRYKLLAIPLHPRRERLRGFNQSKLLANALSKKTGLPVMQGLYRYRYQKPQMEISNRNLRFENINGAFRIQKDVSFDGENIILIDDVTTSGATLQEAAKTLKSAGAKTVIGLVIAKG